MAGIRKTVLISINKVTSGVNSDNQTLKATASQTELDASVSSRDPIRKSKIVATGTKAFYTDGVLYKYFDLTDIFENISDLSRVVQFIRDFSHEFASSDILAIGTTRPVTDEFGSQSIAPTLKVDKGLVDIASYEDILSYVIQFNRQFSDDSVLEDVIAFSLQTNLSDEFQTVDIISVVLTLIRRVTDIVTFDDSQIIAVTKGILEILTSEEQAVIDIQKPFTNINEVIEDFRISAQKPFLEGVDISDLSINSIGKPFEEINFLLETVSSIIQKRLDNIVESNEDIIKSFSKIQSEIVNSDDLSTIQLIKLLEEEVTLFDQINIVSIFNRTFDEINQLGSQGFLVAQNYTIDNTYFSEDYVGQSATFT